MCLRFQSNGNSNHYEDSTSITCVCVRRDVKQNFIVLKIVGDDRVTIMKLYIMFARIVGVCTLFIAYTMDIHARQYIELTREGENMYTT